MICSSAREKGIQQFEARLYCDFNKFACMMTFINTLSPLVQKKNHAHLSVIVFERNRKRERTLLLRLLPSDTAEQPFPMT